MAEQNLDQFAERYITVWNENDPETRRKLVAEIFTEDADHYTPSMYAHGHEQLEARIIRSYDAWVAGGEYFFRAAPGANGHHDAVRFNWEMVQRSNGKVLSIGFDFVLVAEDGRIRTDYQFVDSNAQ